MARSSLAFSNPQFRSGSSHRARSRSRKPEISATLERKWFEFDRNVVNGVLQNLQRSIRHGAAQMEMIAAEQIFDPMLSQAFSRTARRLDRVMLKLRRLEVEVNRATGYPTTQRD